MFTTFLTIIAGLGLSGAFFWYSLYQRGVRGDLEHALIEAYSAKRLLRLIPVEDDEKAQDTGLYRIEVGGNRDLDAGDVLGLWTLFFTPNLDTGRQGQGAVIARSQGAFGKMVSLRILDGMTWRSDVFRDILQRCNALAQELDAQAS